MKRRFSEAFSQIEPLDVTDNQEFWFLADDRQAIETLINEEALLFARYLRNDRLGIQDMESTPLKTY